MSKCAVLSVVAVCLLPALASSSAAEPPSAAAPSAVRVQAIRLDGAPRIEVQVPKDALRPVYFRGAHRRSGWAVRLPAEDAGALLDDGSRVVTGGVPGSALRTPRPSPAVSGGRVFVGGGLQSRALHAFHAGSGVHLWRVQLDDNGPTTVAATPGRVVVNTESCTTYGIDPREGTVTWSEWLGPHVAAAPTVVGDRVITAYTGGEGQDGLVALRLRDGKVLWRRPLRSDLVGPPVYRAGRIYLSQAGGRVTCHGIDGTPLWLRRIEALNAPWVDADALYVAAPPSVRGDSFPAVLCLDRATGQTRWQTDMEPSAAPDGVTVPADRPPRRMSAFRFGFGWASDGPRPVVLSGRCVLGAGSDLVVLDAGTGALTRRLRLPEGHRFHAPPAVLGERLLFATLEGVLVEIDPRTGHVQQALDLQVPVNSQPVVDDGRVYVLAADVLYGTPWDSKDGPSWPQWGGTAARSGT